VFTFKFCFTRTQDNTKVINDLQADFYTGLKFILNPRINRLEETRQRNKELNDENERFIHLLTCHLSSDFYHINSEEEEGSFLLAHWTWIRGRS
jgi:hypothetical protein